MKIKYRKKQNYNLIKKSLLFILVIPFFSCNKKDKIGTDAIIDECNTIRDINISYYDRLLKNGDTLRVRIPVSYGELGIPPCIQMIDWVYSPINDFELIAIFIDKSNLPKTNSVKLEVLNRNRQELILLREDFDVGDTIEFNLYGCDVKRLGKAAGTTNEGGKF